MMPQVPRARTGAGRGGTGPGVNWKRDIWWILGAALVVLAVAAMLLLSCPEENLLPQVYDVL